jgi:hypothetical protein
VYCSCLRYILIDDDEILTPLFISYEGVVSYEIGGVLYDSIDVGVEEGEGTA